MYRCCHIDHAQNVQIQPYKDKLLKVGSLYIKRKYAYRTFFLQKVRGLVNIFDKHNAQLERLESLFSISRCHWCSWI